MIKVPAKLPFREAVGAFPKNVDPVAIAQKWLDSSGSELKRFEDSAVGDTFLPDGARANKILTVTNAHIRPFLVRRLARPSHFHGRLSNNHRDKSDQCHGFRMFPRFCIAGALG
jgi:hypothetical protein